VILFVGSLPLAAQQARPTAQALIDRIQKNVGVAWSTPTVDTFKAGDPSTPITGIAVTMMATLDVIQRAAASDKNLVITHEPTFYSHLDNTADLEKHNDAVLAEKQAFIRDHHMVVWRFHDHWHRRKPDGIQFFDQWWMALFPGLAIFMVAMAFNNDLIRFRVLNLSFLNGLDQMVQDFFSLWRDISA